MSNDAEYQRLAIKIFAEFSGIIAIPAVLGVLLGTWLDDRYSTDPIYLMVSLTIAFTATAIIMVKKAKKYGKIYDKLNENSEKKNE